MRIVSGVYMLSVLSPRKGDNHESGDNKSVSGVK